MSAVGVGMCMEMFYYNLAAGAACESRKQILCMGRSHSVRDNRLSLFSNYKSGRHENWSTKEPGESIAVFSQRPQNPLAPRGLRGCIVQKKKRPQKETLTAMMQLRRRFKQLSAHKNTAQNKGWILQKMQQYATAYMRSKLALYNAMRRDSTTQFNKGK